VIIIIFHPPDMISSLFPSDPFCFCHLCFIPSLRKADFIDIPACYLNLFLLYPPAEKHVNESAENAMNASNLLVEVEKDCHSELEMFSSSTCDSKSSICVLGSPIFPSDAMIDLDVIIDAYTHIHITNATHINATHAIKTFLFIPHSPHGERGHKKCLISFMFSFLFIFHYAFH